MGGVIAPKKPKIDTSAQKAQEDRLKEQDAKLASQEADAARKAAASRKARKSGRGIRSLLSGSALGVEETL